MTGQSIEYSEKLKAVRAEIEALLARHDVAGHVILHEPGFGEVFSCLSPSYSRLQLIVDGSVQYRLRSTLEDYGGDREAQTRDQAATANMCETLAELLGRSALHFIELAQFVNRTLGAEHTEGTFRPDEEPPETPSTEH